MTDIKNKVYNYKTTYNEGFIQDEIDALLKEYPSVDMNKFNDCLTGITCTMRDNHLVIYHSDVELALKCGLEKRDPRPYEWD